MKNKFQEEKRGSEKNQIYPAFLRGGKKILQDVTVKYAEEILNQISSQYISIFLLYLQGGLSGKPCVQSPWHPSAYTNACLPLSLLPAICIHLHDFTMCISFVPTV